MVSPSETSAAGARPRAQHPWVAALPTGVFVALAWAMAWQARGSILSVDWLGYAILGAAVLAGVLLVGPALRPSRPAAIALACLVGLAVWDAISLTWSPVPSLARDEALLVLFYAAALAVPLLTLRTAADRLAALGLLAGGMALLALATGVRLVVSDHPDELFAVGRLATPISYANAQAAMFATAAWAAVCLAARRATPLPLRALAVGGTVALVAGGLIAQSKGMIVGLVVATVVFLAACPFRLRVLVPSLLAGAVVAAGIVPLTGPFRASGAALPAAIRHAGWAVLYLSAIGVLVGVVYVLVDRRLQLGDRTRVLIGRAALAAAVLAAVAGVAAFFVRVDSPAGFFEHKWHQLATYRGDEGASSHFTSLGSNRADFWRVALHQWLDHPVGGVGARGFGAVYLQERRSFETPQRAHSLELEALMETGVVGFALLCGALVPPFVVLARRRRRVPAVAALCGGAYWLAHASVDWIWTFPAATVPFFLLLGIGIAGDRNEGLRVRVRAPLAAVTVLVAALLFAPARFSGRLDRPWLLRTLFLGVPPDQVAAADDDARLARRLDPLSVDPLLIRSRVATDPARRIDFAEQAARREPRSWAVRFELAQRYLEAGRRDDARRELLAARALNPDDRRIAALLGQVGG